MNRQQTQRSRSTQRDGRATACDARSRAKACARCMDSEPHGLSKCAWTHRYAARISASWLARTGQPAAPAVAARIEHDLARLYDDPAERLLVECTY